MAEVEKSKGTADYAPTIITPVMDDTNTNNINASREDGSGSTAVHNTPTHPHRKLSGGEDEDVEKQAEMELSNSPPFEWDKGVWAWSTVFGAWCILFATFGMTNAYGVYQDYYVRTYLSTYTPSSIGWIGSIQIFFQFSMGFFAGKLFDAGHFYPMMVVACAFYAFCYFMLSLAKEQQYYQVFLAQGIGAGIALGFLFLPAISVISHHFKRYRAFAMGIVVSGSSCGGIVFPIMLNKLIEKHGFPTATRAVAATAAGLMALALVTMRTRVPPKPTTPAPAPASTTGSDEKAPAKPAGPPMPTIKELVSDLPYMLTIAAAFVNILGIFTPIFYMQLFAITHSIPPSLAFYTITILNGGSVLGRILPNLFGDLFGPFNAIIVCTLGCAVLILAMLGAGSGQAAIILVSLLYGIFSGAYISLISPLMASLAKGVHEIGIRMGFAFTVVSFAGLAGTPIMGALLGNVDNSHHGDGEFGAGLHWNRPIGVSAAFMFLGFGLLIVARSITAGRKGTWKV
ncbi:hypothetical protein FRC14_004522 [Serendipita sp. 396]|nr:hypothetical protein FRC14_004522 [Serendipita sp. 396]